jgi:hypothetical protein
MCESDAWCKMLFLMGDLGTHIYYHHTPHVQQLVKVKNLLPISEFPGFWISTGLRFRKRISTGAYVADDDLEQIMSSFSCVFILVLLLHTDAHIHGKKKEEISEGNRRE